MARKLKKRAYTRTAPNVDEAKPQSSDDNLSLVRRQFTDAMDSSVEERTEAEEHRRYYDNIQWSEAERKVLAGRGQPVVTDNKIKDKILYLLGMERKTRTDPKAYPRNRGDEESADAATDALRYVGDDNLFNYVRSDASENMFIEGRGAVEIVVDKKARGGEIPKIALRHIPWDRVYVDPHSLKCDYSDKSYIGTITWMDDEDAFARWSDKKEVIQTSFDDAPVAGSSFEDKPRWIINTTTRKRIQVFQHYYKRRGKWWYCEFVWGGFLKSPAESAYQDDSGDPECPIEMQAMYREGETGRAYSDIRRMKDLQDEWNKRGSKALHLLNVNQVIMEDGAAAGDEGDSAKAIEKVRKEAARPDGVLTVLPGMKLEIVKNTDLSSGNLQMMQMRGAALDMTGPNAALAGQTGHVSGRAKELDQQGGLVAIDRPFDSIKYLTLRIYRQVWNRITQFWTAETWIRVRDEDQLEYVALNRKTTRAEIIAERLKTSAMEDQEKQQIIAHLMQDPEMHKPYVHNNVAELDVDITIDDSPDVVTLQNEQFGILAELAKSGAVQIPARALIEASSLRSATKRKILDMMSGANDPAQAAMAKMQQQMQELQMQTLQLKNALLESQVHKTQADAMKSTAASHESDVDSSVKLATFLSPPEPTGPAGAKAGNGAAKPSGGKTSVSVN